jgi:predicted 2-oxoglutarate/Fe(II)-dependent dioxygenase YbiX
MSSLNSKIAKVLSTVERPGDFFASGTVEMLAPRLEVEGVGQIALPLLPVQAEQLVAAAERAPYGRGTETLVDTDVRRTWQIGAERVRIGGKHWAQTLDAILKRVSGGLGVSEPIAAELYKLLVYDQGSFFVSHRDTEKAAGMFATLVVVLPSISTGGELVVRHKGREARPALRSDEPSEVSFAAFYADCVHEVLPVTSGCRLALVFNLVRKGRGSRLVPPSYEAEQEQAAELLRQWAAEKASVEEAGKAEEVEDVDATDDAEEEDDAVPAKLVVPLEHAYTPAELGFAGLKGADAAMAGVLAAAATAAVCELHLALLSIEESGSAEYTESYGSRRGRWRDEPELEVGEVIERYEYLSEWRRSDDEPVKMGNIPLGAGEVCPPDALDDMEPDEQHFHEATGNEGASFERTYRRAALVIWPADRKLAVLNQAGRSVTLPYLESLAERWAADGEDRSSAPWREAHELAGLMVSTWPAREWVSDEQAPTEATRMLASLTRLADLDRIEALAAAMTAGGHHFKGDNAALIAALGLSSPERAGALLERHVTGTAASSFGACGDLLAQAIGAFPDHPAALRPALAALIDALPGDPKRAPPRDPWRSRPEVNAAFVVDLFRAVVDIDRRSAERTADHMLAWPKAYGLDAVLIPALREMVKSPAIMGCDGVKRLRAACLDHLQTRVAKPLEAPKDWRRESKVGCQCAQCAELSRFLADPSRPSWILKAAEPTRRHVEDTIKRARSDLAMKTERKGSPHSLVCTKNQASYDRRAAQRKRDLADLERFRP